MRFGRLFLLFPFILRPQPLPSFAHVARIRVPFRRAGVKSEDFAPFGGQEIIQFSVRITP